MAKEKVKHEHNDKTHSHEGGDKVHSHEITASVVQLKPSGTKIIDKHGIIWKDKIEDQIKEIKEKKTVTNVYSADYKLIDDTIEEIKKASRKVCTNDYAANNVYVILQFALKKVVLAEA